MDATRRSGKRSRSSSRSLSQPPLKKQHGMDVVDGSCPKSYQSEKQPRNLDQENTINLRIGLSTHGLWAGPMEPASFLDRFLPRVQGGKARPDFKSDTFASVVVDQTRKREMADALVDQLSPFSPGLKLSSVHSATDNLWNGFASDATDSPTTHDEEESANDYSQIQIPWVLKLEESEDPFSDQYPNSTKENRFPFERDDDEHSLTRGQLGSCLFLAGSHFRCHVFAFLICGKWARLIRGDRAGAIVTKRFPLAEEDHLVEFFWRYSHTPPGDPIRGYDPTLRPLDLEDNIPTPEENAARTKLAEANSKAHRDFRILMIPDRETDQEYEFIISYPLKCARRSPFGRATKPMLAFDRTNNKMVFVKDYWRSVDVTLKEGDTYKILVDAGVPYIPHFGAGNDVRNHCTITDVIRKEDWVYPTATMTSLRHYRMALEEIGRPLNTFRSSHELVTAIADAMEAHEIAFHDAGILHRDISTSNILITEQGRGLLIDWDLSFNMKHDNRKGPNPAQIGTSEFWSVALLSSRNHVQGALDDQESALYVLLWNLLRHTKHNRTSTLREQLKMFDIGRGPRDQSPEDRKTLFLLSRYRDLDFDNRPHLQGLIEEFAFSFSVRYEKPMGAALRAFLEKAADMMDDLSNQVVRERNIANRSWLVRTMRKYLEPRHEWPSDDAACENPLDTKPHYYY